MLMLKSKKLSGFQIYRHYKALKVHFNSDFDYFKHLLSDRITIEAFADRNDRDLFNQAARYSEPVQVMLANFAHNPKIWIGEIFSPEGLRIYDAWNRRNQALTYTFREEIKVLDPDFGANFTVKPGQHPRLLKLFMSGKISLETLVIVVDLSRCLKYWTEKLDPDDLIWQDVSNRVIKYRPFLEFPKARFRQILRDQFEKNP